MEKNLKHIVIIGNGAINKNFSYFIDSSDFVVRLNEAGNYGGNSGTKVDALCITNLSTPGRLFSKYKKIQKLAFINFVKEIWFPRPSNYLPFQFWLKPFNRVSFSRADYRNHILKRNNLQDKNIISFSEELYTLCCHELGIERDSIEYFPSTGYLSISYVKNRFRHENICITLLGFSFEGTHCHKWEKEKDNVIKMLNDSKLNLNWLI